jgi:hypothetical protein
VAEGRIQQVTRGGCGGCWSNDDEFINFPHGPKKKGLLCKPLTRAVAPPHHLITNLSKHACLSLLAACWLGDASVKYEYDQVRPRRWYLNGGWCSNICDGGCMGVLCEMRDELCLLRAPGMIGRSPCEEAIVQLVPQRKRCRIIAFLSPTLVHSPPSIYHFGGTALLSSSHLLFFSCVYSSRNHTSALSVKPIRIALPRDISYWTETTITTTTMYMG